MNPNKILVGADHNGYEVKAKIVSYLTELGYDCKDEGALSFDSEDDFTTYAQKVAEQVSVNDNYAGILICGSGQGMTIAANRFKRVRASLNHTADQAMMARKHNDSNVCCLSSQVVGDDQSLLEDILNNFFETEFLDQPKYRRRIEQIDNF